MKSDRQSDGRSRPGSPQLKAILVVDDDKQLASALQWILADESFLVDIAFDGEEALLKVKAHEYDAIICDLKLPRLRGHEFYLMVKDIRPSLADRFIFITGYVTDVRVHKFLTMQEVNVPCETFPGRGFDQLRQGTALLTELNRAQMPARPGFARD